MSGIIELDFSELTKFQKDTLSGVQKRFPGEAKRFIRDAGNIYRRKLRTAYKDETKKKTGNLLRGIDRGKPYVYNGNEYQIRVYNKAPHAHLIEHGHKLWRHLPNEKKAVKTDKWVKGRNIAGKAANNFSKEFTKLAQDFVDETIERGFY